MMKPIRAKFALATTTPASAQDSYRDPVGRGVIISAIFLLKSMAVTVARFLMRISLMDWRYGALLLAFAASEGAHAQSASAPFPGAYDSTVVNAHIRPSFHVDAGALNEPKLTAPSHAPDVESIRVLPKVRFAEGPMSVISRPSTLISTPYRKAEPLMPTPSHSPF